MSEEPPGLQGKGWCPQSGAVQGGRGGVTGRLGEGTGGTKLQGRDPSTSDTSLVAKAGAWCPSVPGGEEVAGGSSLAPWARVAGGSLSGLTHGLWAGAGPLGSGPLSPAGVGVSTSASIWKLGGS